MKVYIGSAVWRSLEAEHLRSLVPLLRDGHYGYFPQIGDALIERARGMSATNFLRNTDADVHLSLDSDIMGFTKEGIDQLCEQAVEYGIVGAVYITRATARTFPTTMFHDKTRIEFSADPTPVPVKWAATGCLAVHRRVFEKMAESLPLLHEKDGPRAFYNFYHSMEYEGDEDMGRILLSEDYAFCERARQAGFEIYVNPAIRLGHIGPYVHRLEDMAQTPLKPQPLALTHIGRHWRIECAGEKEDHEAMGRIAPGKSEELNRLFEELKTA